MRKKGIQNANFSSGWRIFTMPSTHSKSSVITYGTFFRPSFNDLWFHLLHHLLIYDNRRISVPDTVVNDEYDTDYSLVLVSLSWWHSPIDLFCLSYNPCLYFYQSIYLDCKLTFSPILAWTKSQMKGGGKCTITSEGEKSYSVMVAPVNRRLKVPSRSLILGLRGSNCLSSTLFPLIRAAPSVSTILANLYTCWCLF
ncbi:hypothetical protein BDV26DRAFT_23879 [Aspergillus bertholletiae]|uniref:Uncharacterized protein n=1 Tax=Aspergillus bertholletiae TaxID=1226010 RepID=A0A5N7AZ97_9EURO|nr:hypothetical protein BDV26DRAFT_23879 [Aspergillus bertholletiae]